LFQPLGFVGPFLLPVKVILQQLWRIDASWDDPIQEPKPMSYVANLKILGMELHKLNLKCHWWCRPAFLLCPEEEWPSLSISSVSEHYSDVQLEKSVMSITQGSSLKQLLKHFSSWPGLLTIVMEIWSDNGTNFTGADKEIPLAIGQWKR